MATSRSFGRASSKPLKKKRGQKYDPRDPRYQELLQDSAEALAVVLNFFKHSSGSALRAWLRTFDKNMDMCVTLDEFEEGMIKLGYVGDVDDLFRRIDVDKSGEVMLDEVNLPEARLWMRFRLWCASHFQDSEHMLYVLSNGKEKTICGKSDFINGLQRLGWDGGHEDMLFECIDKDDDGLVCLAYLKWFEIDKKRQLRKEQAKKKSGQKVAQTFKERHEIAKAIKEFKSFLRSKYGSLVRAWRSAIDLDGSMTCQKPELFNAVKALSWPGDAKMLWKGLDKDSSGVTSLQELDTRTAERLAKFKKFTEKKFGSTVEAFRAFDVQNKGKLKEREFIDACKKEGFSEIHVSLFRGLDWQKNKYIMEKDVEFLDSWRCPLYLTCEANEQAAEELKAAFIKRFKNHVKAWRTLLDRDNSNCVCWEEFEAAAKRIDFDGDIHGAWRFLDADASGFISLREMDAAASKVISEFKFWSDQEFGSTRLAFAVFDADGSNELTRKEWRKACMAFGYPGDSRALFEKLDADFTNLVTLNEVAFIDNWELSPAQLADMHLECKAPEETERKFVKTVVQASPRLAKLALPKAIADSNSVAVDDADSKEYKSLKHINKRSVSPYLPKLNSRPRLSSTAAHFTDGFTSARLLKAASPSRTPDPVLYYAQVDTLKGLILQKPMEDLPTDCLPAISESNGFDLMGIRQKTRDLRSRTLCLLGKAEDSKLQFRSPLPDGSERKVFATSKLPKLQI